MKHQAGRGPGDETVDCRDLTGVHQGPLCCVSQGVGLNESYFVINEMLALEPGEVASKGRILDSIFLNIFTVEFTIFRFTQSGHIKNGAIKTELNFCPSQVVLRGVLEPLFSVVLGDVPPLTNPDFVLAYHPVQRLDFQVLPLKIFQGELNISMPRNRNPHFDFLRINQWFHIFGFNRSENCGVHIEAQVPKEELLGTESTL